MMPLTYFETQGFNLEKIVISGLIPPHFLSDYPIQDIRSYVVKQAMTVSKGIHVLPWQQFLEMLWQGELDS
jgi:hypothetical protein